MKKRLHSRRSVLNVPWIVDYPAVKKEGMSDSHVRETLNMFPKIKMALVGIGAPTPESVVMRDGTILTECQTEMLMKKGAIGDICPHNFDEKGQSIQSKVGDRVIGISMDE